MDTCFMTKMTWQSTGERMVFQQMVKDQMHIHMEKDETWFPPYAMHKNQLQADFRTKCESWNN